MLAKGVHVGQLPFTEARRQPRTSNGCWHSALMCCSVGRFGSSLQTPRSHSLFAFHLGVPVLEKCLKNDQRRNK